MATDKIDLQPIKDEGFDDVGEKVVTSLEKAFDSLPQLSLQEAAKVAAVALQEVIRLNIHSDKEWLFETLWQTVVSVTKCVPHRHQGQHLLVQVLLHLNVKEESFQGLPALGRCLRDNWIDPTFEVVEGGPETNSLDEWLNLNSFTARICEAGIINGPAFAVWQLRHGLEENLLTDDAAAASNSSRVAVASEWLIQASPATLRRCLVQKQDELDEHAKRSLRGGELYTGLPGHDIERWGFWKRRLLTLRQGTESGLTDVVGETIAAMESAAVSLLQ